MQPFTIARLLSFRFPRQLFKVSFFYVKMEIFAGLKFYKTVAKFRSLFSLNDVYLLTSLMFIESSETSSAAGEGKERKKIYSLIFISSVRNSEGRSSVRGTRNYM